MLLQNGNPQQAAIYIKQAQDYVNKIEDNEAIKAFTDLNSAAVYATQGFYAKAIEFITENEKYFSIRATNKTTNIDPKTGKLKTVKFSANETASRLNDYAWLMNLKANSYRLMGDFVKADETFFKAADWIDNNQGKSNIRYVENKLWQGRMLEENGLDPKVSRKTYENALSNLKKQHTESHYLALEIYESLLDSYLVNNEMAKFKNLHSERIGCFKCL